MGTEKDGGLQSEPIENTDGVDAVTEEVSNETTEAPAKDDVQLAELAKLISERERAAEEKAAKHFQSVKDKEVAAERRRAIEAEKSIKLLEARVEGFQDTFMAGLDPEARAEAQRRSDAKVAQRKAELDRPSPEMLAEAQDFQEKVLKARAFAAQLEAEGDIETDFKNMKCSDPSIVMTSPDEYIKTAKVRLKELRNPVKAKETEVEKPEKKEEPPKKAPKVTEGGAKGSSMSDEEFIKAYAKGERNSPADHKRANKILTGG